MFLCKGILELYGGVCFNCGQLRLKDQIPYYGPPPFLFLSLSPVFFFFFPSFKRTILYHN